MLPFIAHAEDLATKKTDILISINSIIPGGISNIFKLAIGLGSLLAFGVIIYGGILYSVAGAKMSYKTDGKEWVMAGVKGLLLLIVGFSIIQAINPRLQYPKAEVEKVYDLVLTAIEQEEAKFDTSSLYSSSDAVYSGSSTGTDFGFVPGTKIDGNGKWLNFSATSYTATPEETDSTPDATRTGATVRWGIVAVDPKYIPLGSKLNIKVIDDSGLPSGLKEKIEGITFDAEDTGRAIKGNKIDILLPLNSSATNQDKKILSNSWGIRSIKIEIVSCGTLNTKIKMNSSEGSGFFADSYKTTVPRCQ